VHKGRWSKEEDEALTAAVKPHLNDASLTEDNLPWSRIAQYIPNRTGIQCQARWTEALDPSVRKGRWRKEEDDMLKVGVERFGCCWIRVAGSIPGRTQRQCRTRWNQIESKRQKLQEDTTASKPAIIKKQQKKRKRVEGSVVQWKAASQQSTTNALSATPIQLAVPDQTPYILLSKQPSNAIVIPSEILSPLQSPSASSASSTDDEDYFCTSPTSTCSSDTFTKQDVSTPLSAIDAATILDDFDSSFASFMTEKPCDNTTNDLMFTSLFSNEFLTQFDPDLPSLMLLDVPFSQPQQQTGPEQETISLENLLLDSEIFLNYPSNTSILSA
jgi:hypothetical protein